MLDGSFLNDQTLHVFLGFRQTLFSFACDSEELLYCNKYTESILGTSRSHCNSSKRSNNNNSVHLQPYQVDVVFILESTMKLWDPGTAV